jgi:putative GTP pyrophosphokinase
MTPKNEISIIEEFEKYEGTFKLCLESVVRLIQNILEKNGIKYHTVSGRVKDHNKLQEKIVRKGNKYRGLHEITDIVGVRVITYFEDEVDKVAKLISKEFIIDGENSVDKRVTESDRFGYRSLHYVVSFTKARLGLTEYASFNEIKIEIQIRSILQHSWAEIEHDLGYKGEFEIPDVAKRTFYRLSAILELADIEFVRLKEIILTYEESINKIVEENKIEVSIDKASLLAYIHNNENITSQIEPISKVYNFAGRFGVHKDIDTSRLIERLQKQNIKTINQLDALIKKYKKEALEHLKQTYNGHKINTLNAAAPIYNLLSYLEDNGG